MSSLDYLAIIIASLGHDIGHPGTTNRYLVSTKDSLALQYNDRSVLENMHCSLLFKILSTAECNFLSNLYTNNWVEFRKTIIEIILATDMTKHYEILMSFKSRVSTISILDFFNFDDKILILLMIVKSSDIGYCAKELDLHIKWIKLASEEFFLQGDLEKAQGLPVSMFCDRNNKNMLKSCFSFMSNVCLPLYEIWEIYLKNHSGCQVVFETFKRNFEHWEECYKERSQALHASFSKDPNDLESFIPKFRRNSTG